MSEADDAVQTQEGAPGQVATPLLLPRKLSRKGRKPLLPRVLTLREAAAILRCSVEQLRRAITTGQLHAFRLGPNGYGGWRTTDLAVLAFMGFPVPGFKQVEVKRGFPGRPHGGSQNSTINRAKTPEEKSDAARVLNRRSVAKRAARTTLHIGSDSGDGRVGLLPAGPARTGSDDSGPTVCGVPQAPSDQLP